MESNWTHVCCMHGIFVFSHTHDVLVVAAAHFLARGITVCQNEGRWIANSQLLNQTTHCILEVRIAYHHDHFHTRAWHVSTHHTESVQSQPEAILIASKFTSCGQYLCVFLQAVRLFSNNSQLNSSIMKELCSGNWWMPTAVVWVCRPLRRSFGKGKLWWTYYQGYLE